MDIQKLYSPEGPLPQVMPGYEPRPGQATMAQAVDDAMRQGGSLLVEAGTGTGKSLAYLLPLLRNVGEKESPVLLSTHTLNLQTQLLVKDLPLAKKALGADVRVARAMGRGNYACLLRLSLLDGGEDDLFEPGQTDALRRVREWAEAEPQPTLERVPFALPPGVWEAARVEAYGCLGPVCPFADRCFFLKDRAAMMSADLLVCNHALLMADTAGRARGGEGILPDADVLVLDEAQHLERVASDHLGLRFHGLALARPLARLAGGSKRGRGLGTRLDPSGNLLGMARQAQLAARIFDDSIRAWLLSRGAGRVAQAEAKGLIEDSLSQPLLDLVGALRDAGTRARELTETAALSAEAASLGARLEASAAELRAWIGQEEPDAVYWAEEERGSGATLRSAPLEAGERLAKTLWPRFKTAVLTSATLTVQDNFDFTRRRLGLGEDTRTLTLPSAFDYRSQVCMHLTATAPGPKPDGDAYLEGLVQGTRAALEMSKGRAFVLFTSFEHLRMVANRLRSFVEERGWLFLEQGRGANRDVLLKSFQEHGRAVLFGASSFWEGVDVPGEALSCVIITRLPFQPPDGPLEKARAARLKSAGGDPFRQLALPEAVLKLKQGFGRLIRHGEDEGWFHLLDSRVLTKSYGRAFLRSLPACRLYVDGVESEGPWAVESGA